jgi:hypothetical protein
MQSPFKRFFVVSGAAGDWGHWRSDRRARGSSARRTNPPHIPAWKRRCHIVCNGDWLRFHRLATQRPAASFDRPDQGRGSAVSWATRGCGGAAARRRGDAATRRERPAKLAQGPMVKHPRRVPLALGHQGCLLVGRTRRLACASTVPWGGEVQYLRISLLPWHAGNATFRDFVFDSLFPIH